MEKTSKIKKQIFPILILILITMIFGLVVFAKTKKPDNPPVNNQIILFYGQECPHCQKLDEWLTANKIADKVKFDKKEVYHNQNNAQILASKAEKCGYNTNSIGVPFLSDGDMCYSGGEEIQKFFENKINVK
jgi:glutaredoxin